MVSEQEAALTAPLGPPLLRVTHGPDRRIQLRDAPLPVEQIQLVHGSGRYPGREIDMIVIFDLNGTLTDAAGIAEPWQAPDLGLDVLAGAVETAMVETILGEHTDFSHHIRSALEVRVARRSLDSGRIDNALQRAKQLSPYPDAAEALELLAEAGHRLGVL